MHLLKDRKMQFEKQEISLRSNYEMLILHTQSPTEADYKASDLRDHLNQNRRQRWEEAVESIDFCHSSRLARQTFNRLTGHSNRTKKCPVYPNAIGHQLLCNGRYKNVDEEATRAVKQEIKQL